jgi:hypothetical protein
MRTARRASMPPSSVQPHPGPRHGARRCGRAGAEPPPSSCPPLADGLSGAGEWLTGRPRPAHSNDSPSAESTVGLHLTATSNVPGQAQGGSRFLRPSPPGAARRGRARAGTRAAPHQRRDAPPHAHDPHWRSGQLADWIEDAAVTRTAVTRRSMPQAGRRHREPSSYFEGAVSPRSQDAMDRLAKQRRFPIFG